MCFWLDRTYKVWITECNHLFKSKNREKVAAAMLLIAHCHLLVNPVCPVLSVKMISGCRKKEKWKKMRRPMKAYHLKAVLRSWQRCFLKPGSEFVKHSSSVVEETREWDWNRWLRICAASSPLSALLSVSKFAPRTSHHPPPPWKVITSGVMIFSDIKRHCACVHTPWGLIALLVRTGR